MKKFLSLSLALLLILSAATVFSLSTAAADSFKEGDVLYFKVENPANWTQNATLYANFTDAPRRKRRRFRHDRDRRQNALQPRHRRHL